MKKMIVDLYTKVVLTIIAASLFVLTLTTAVSPIKAYAQFNQKETSDGARGMSGDRIAGLFQEVLVVGKEHLELLENQRNIIAQAHDTNKNIEDALLFIQHEIFSRGLNVHWKSEGIAPPVK
ncbi:MAG: hypothetical protein HN472_01860 [Nitrospina sp.]|jgi:hypothetical protein|nr:hypothetical protein [Nitrospina sp.]MBT4049369.1 hypothetical protein [Nitrospina sp.]MBT4557775.1 hypothetical protein [Nitrospina sp.]MBT5026873.1 hypothetical protein [Nitrospina sp.]MBT6738838.1 hypothetical protein [Nitrospina sp.]